MKARFSIVESRALPYTEFRAVLLTSIPSRLRYSTFYVPLAGNTKGGTFSAEPAVRQCGDLP